MTPFLKNLQAKLNAIIAGEAPGDHNKAQAILPLIELIKDQPDDVIKEALGHATPGILASVEAMEDGSHKMTRDEKAEAWDDMEDITASGEGMPEA